MRASIRAATVILAGGLVAGGLVAGLPAGTGLRAAAVPTLRAAAVPAAEGEATAAATGDAVPRIEQDRWGWPVEDDRQVLRPFIAPTHRWSPGHRGVDLRARTAILHAPAAGVVRFAGWVVDRPVLSIDHGGVVSSYEPVTTQLSAGDPVAAGQRLGIVEPGHCAVRCVHVGVRVAGDYRNPLLWLGEVPRSVLLPTRPLG